MDYKKIGDFIATERKAKKLTQSKLAEKIFVSEKTVSKWENGNGIPDTNTLPKLCAIFDITINELLNGERITEEKYKNNAELKLIELSKQNEFKNKKIYFTTWVLAVLVFIFYLGIVFLANFTLGEGLILGIIVIVSTILLVIGAFFLFKQELEVSYYECKNCNHKFTPSYKEAIFACHTPKTKHLKCPRCGKKSWVKRIMTK